MIYSWSDIMIGATALLNLQILYEALAPWSMTTGQKSLQYQMIWGSYFFLTGMNSWYSLVWSRLCYPSLGFLTELIQDEGKSFLGQQSCTRCVCKAKVHLFLNCRVAFLKSSDFHDTIKIPSIKRCQNTTFFHITSKEKFSHISLWSTGVVTLSSVNTFQSWYQI